MSGDSRAAAAAEVMEAFLARTGVVPPVAPRRYLWTDAFAVCNCLALHQAGGAAVWLGHARQLVHQVHRVLGRHRPDDPRTGWISGLDEATGARHPTAGGLRIGKPLPERRPGEPADDRVDWDRDGQYYHYLTRWLHALGRMAAVTGEAEPWRHAAELAVAMHGAFLHEAGGHLRIHWKMSIDLSRPVVASMGDHDALDGLVTTAGLLEVASPDADAAMAAHAPLQEQVRDLAALCADRGWATPDALGIGGLLVNALLLTRLRHVVPAADRVVERVLHDAARSLELIALGHHFDAPAAGRLAFRELGLSLGLAAAERLARGGDGSGVAQGRARMRIALERVQRHLPLRERIEAFWLEPRNQAVDTWLEHEDINAVMLATSLLPDGFLG